MRSFASSIHMMGSSLAISHNGTNQYVILKLVTAAAESAFLAPHGIRIFSNSPELASLNIFYV